MHALCRHKGVVTEFGRTCDLVHVKCCPNREGSIGLNIVSSNVDSGLGTCDNVCRDILPCLDGVAKLMGISCKTVIGFKVLQQKLPPL